MWTKTTNKSRQNKPKNFPVDVRRVKTTQCTSFPLYKFLHWRRELADMSFVHEEGQRLSLSHTSCVFFQRLTELVHSFKVSQILWFSIMHPHQHTLPQRAFSVHIHNTLVRQTTELCWVCTKYTLRKPTTSLASHMHTTHANSWMCT